MILLTPTISGVPNIYMTVGILTISFQILDGREPCSIRYHGTWSSSTTICFSMYYSGSKSSGKLFGAASSMIKLSITAYLAVFTIFLVNTYSLSLFQRYSIRIFFSCGSKSLKLYFPLLILSSLLFNEFSSKSCNWVLILLTRSIFSLFELYLFSKVAHSKVVVCLSCFTASIDSIRRRIFFFSNVGVIAFGFCASSRSV